MQRNELIDKIKSASGDKPIAEVVASTLSDLGYGALTDDALAHIARQYDIEAGETAQERRSREWNKDIASEVDAVRSRIQNGATTLRGSPKQIAWAERLKKLAVAQNPHDPAYRRAAAKQAEWWIENYKHLNRR